MRIITNKVIVKFWEAHADVEGELRDWVYVVEHASWKSPADVKERFRSADIVGDNRIVFNIRGNKYRLVAKIHYNTGMLFIRFIGTHAEYDRIDAEVI